MSKIYIIDRVLHWLSALLLLTMLMILSTQLHNVNWEIKGQLLHRQDAVESHATVGVLLLAVTIVRLVFYHFYKCNIPRLAPRSRKHQWFIKVTHLALNVCIVLLFASGFIMLNNYEIPLMLFSVEIEASKQGFYHVFPDIHQWHMWAKSALWWLIAIHFVGIIYARK